MEKIKVNEIARPRQYGKAVLSLKKNHICLGKGAAAKLLRKSEELPNRFNVELFINDGTLYLRPVDVMYDEDLTFTISGNSQYNSYGKGVCDYIKHRLGITELSVKCLIGEPDAEGLFPVFHTFEKHLKRVGGVQ